MILSLCVKANPTPRAHLGQKAPAQGVLSRVNQGIRRDRIEPDQLFDQDFGEPLTGSVPPDAAGPDREDRPSQRAHHCLSGGRAGECHRREDPLLAGRPRGLPSRPSRHGIGEGGFRGAPGLDLRHRGEPGRALHARELKPGQGDHAQGRDSRHRQEQGHTAPVHGMFRSSTAALALSFRAWATLAIPTPPARSVTPRSAMPTRATAPATTTGVPARE